jgi:hypothetical protein
MTHGRVLGVRRLGAVTRISVRENKNWAFVELVG